MTKAGFAPAFLFASLHTFHALQRQKRVDSLVRQPYSAREQVFRTPVLIRSYLFVGGATVTSLSPRQQQILDFVREYHADHSYMPSVREIQTACEISSTSVVDYNLRILEREGIVLRSPDISRGLE